MESYRRARRVAIRNSNENGKIVQTVLLNTVFADLDPSSAAPILGYLANTVHRLKRLNAFVVVNKNFLIGVDKDSSG